MIKLTSAPPSPLMCRRLQRRRKKAKIEKTKREEVRGAAGRMVEGVGVAWRVVLAPWRVVLAYIGRTCAVGTRTYWRPCHHLSIRLLVLVLAHLTLIMQKAFWRFCAVMEKISRQSCLRFDSPDGAITRATSTAGVAPFERATGTRPPVLV